MKGSAEGGNRQKINELLEKELLFMEILRKLHVNLSQIVERLESLKQLAEELKACEVAIFKRYFFPIDKTIEAFAKQPLVAEDELTKTTQEDLSKILHVIEVLDGELMKKEQEIKDLRDEAQKFRGILITT